MSRAMTTRILIADDHGIVREGVRSLLRTSRPEWEILEAADGIQTIEVTRDLKPDLVVMDITMPGLSGLDVVSRLRKMMLGCPILMFTMHESPRLGIEARQAGAQGYVLKSQAVENLVRAIDILLAGGTFFGAPSQPERTGGDEPNPGVVFCSGLAPG
jgi:two-component system invasion response regulator UvrY